MVELKHAISVGFTNNRNVYVAEVHSAQPCLPDELRVFAPCQNMLLNFSSLHDFEFFIISWVRIKQDTTFRCVPQLSW